VDGAPSMTQLAARNNYAKPRAADEPTVKAEPWYMKELREQGGSKSMSTKQADVMSNYAED